MGVVHRLPTSPIACIPWDIVPACEVAHRSDSSRIHIHVLIVFATPAIIVEVQKRLAALSSDLELY